MSGHLPGVLIPLTVPLSWVYGRIIDRRNRAFDAGRDVHSVDVPVISVGNITTGGTGKTPTVRWIAEHVRSLERRPVIAMRGYGARDGEQSDEHAEYELMLPDIPVLANPDRVAALRGYLPAHPEIDCVILDDGFQHRRLHRDLDLVLIDAAHGITTDRLLPAGTLREPPRALRRASAVIVTRAESPDPSLAETIERLHGKPPVAWTRHAWRQLHVHSAEGTSVEPVEWLHGRAVMTSLGVGNPRSIERQLADTGAKIVVSFPARDHQRYDRPAVTSMRTMGAGLDALVVTNKDWVKLRHLIDWRTWPMPIVAPVLEIEVFEGLSRLEAMIANAAADHRAT